MKLEVTEKYPSIGLTMIKSNIKSCVNKIFSPTWDKQLGIPGFAIIKMFNGSYNTDNEIMNSLKLRGRFNQTRGGV